MVDEPSDTGGRAEIARDQRDEEDALFREFRRTGSRRIRNDLVERHMGLAAHVARRFGRRGPPPMLPATTACPPSFT